jgi:hypothetical protein
LLIFQLLAEGRDCFRCAHISQCNPIPVIVNKCQP